MQDQHTIEGQSHSTYPVQGIFVPLDLPGLRILKQSIRGDGTIEVHVISPTESEACPQCGAKSEKVHDTRIRIKRDIAIRSHQVEIMLHKRRFSCPNCQRTFTENDVACGRRRRTTKQFREYLAKQACRRAITHIAQEASMGPRFVHECLVEYVEERFAEDNRTLKETGPLPTPRFLGIDEFARRKGHCYDTILCDLEHRKVLEVCEGRTHEDVVKMLKRLDNHEKVEAVSMDMSGSFRGSVHEVLPHAKIVADHFHVNQHVEKAFKKVLQRVCATKEAKSLMKGKRPLFLLAKEDLTVEQEEERAKLEELFPDIARAWSLKENLRRWYHDSDASNAAQGLDCWITKVEKDGPPEMREALSAFRNWREEILAFFTFLPDNRITNGFVEGKNNRTKALMRQAYGYRNRLNLRLRILCTEAAA
jgi:transposase